VEIEAIPKTFLPTPGPGEEATMISADTLDDLEVNNLMACPNGKCLATKHHQTLFGDQTC